MAFAEIKARLRAAELRTTDKIENFFSNVHDAFQPDECRAYHSPHRVHRYALSETALNRTGFVPLSVRGHCPLNIT
ncbi:MAG: hypothetical protein K2V38_08400 [Gemmataceae bacterium]|nr:hypothetical protein [Gemmataceae bacterium]